MPRRLRLPGSQAVIWAFAEASVAAIFSLASILLIGRIIGPDAVGVGMIALAAFLLLDLIASSIWPEALVQLRQLTPQHARSVLTFATLCGAIGSIVLLLIAPLLGGASTGEDGRSLVTPLAIALAPLLPVSAFANAASSLLLRERRYRLLALRVLIGQPLALAVAVGLGLAGQGAWAMVAIPAIGIMVSVGLLLGFGRLALRPLLDFRSLRELVPVAGPQSAATLVHHGKYRLLMAGLGSVLASATIAQTHFAIRVVEGATTPVWQVMTRLCLTRLCAVQTDRHALAETFGELAQLQALLGLPVAVGVALIAPELAEALLGPAWAGTGDATRATALSVALFFLIGGYNQLFVAVGKAGINLGMALATFGAQVAAVVLLQPQTANDMAIAFAASGVVICIVLTYLVLVEIRRSLFWLLRRIAPALIATAAMATAVLLLRYGVPMRPFTSLVSSILLGAAVYVLAAWSLLGRRLPSALGTGPRGHVPTHAEPLAASQG